MKDYFSQQKLLVKDLEQSFYRNQYNSTVVGMQEDYENDQQECLTSVSFVPGDIATKIIEKVIQPMKISDPEHYFFNEASLHLTIKNIRTISNPPLFSEVDIYKVQNLFNEVIPQFNQIEFIVEDVVLFPTSVSVMAYASNELQRLVLALDEGLKSIGVPDNKKYLSDSIFWGNITICRFTKKPNEDLIKVIKMLRNTKIGRFKVDKVNLVTCNSVCSPNSRKIIETYNLNNS
jgi:2'-5' RNA ligase